MEPILSFAGEFAFLSNFWPCPSFGSVEHEFQAAKFVDEAAKQMIRSQTTPGRAKRQAHKLIEQGAETQENWNALREGVMLNLLQRKFAEPDMRALLLSTGTRELMEGNNWHDVFWGICQCEEHAGHGQNILGRLLMEVRTACASTK